MPSSMAAALVRRCGRILPSRRAGTGLRVEETTARVCGSDAL